MLNHPIRKPLPANADQGFTLIELLVVILILSFLAALAWPMMLHHSAKAREAKALNLVGAMNRAQNYFYLTNNRFATSLEELGFAHITQDDTFHAYSIQVATGNIPLSKVTAVPTDPTLKGYTGLVYQTENTHLDSKLCQGQTNQAPDPLVADVSGKIQVDGCDDI